MHFYTYDEWYNNAYYSKDNTEIPTGNTRIVPLADISEKYLTIRSCYKNPEFISTYTGTPSISVDLEPVDVDIGCLYLKNGSYSTKSQYRALRGCVQVLGNNFGSTYTDPYIAIYNTGGSAHAEYVEFSQTYKEVLSIDLTHITEYSKILIFQSIYSGAIEFQDARTSLEFAFSDYLPGSSSYNWVDYTYKISTKMYSADSLMIAGAMITVDSVADSPYLIIDCLNQFVYGHVDMDETYDYGILWKAFEPSRSSVPLESSLIHYTK